MYPPLRLLTLSATALAVTGLSARAVDDGAPVDLRAALEALKTIKEKQTGTIKQARSRNIAAAEAAATNPARAVELWEEAIRATQFQGVSKEGAAWREWRDKDGSAMKEREVHTALRLYFNWLAITLKHADGVSTKDLLPAILGHVKEAIADQASMDAFDEVLKKEREAAQAPNQKKANPRDREKRNNDGAVKKMHDDIALRPLASSVYAEWMRMSDMITDVAPAPERAGGGGGGNQGRRAGGAAQPQNRGPQPGAIKKDAPSTAWEGVPGSVDGIYTTIIQPELRDQGDARVLEYWDYRLRHEGDIASRSKLNFEIEKFNTLRRPQLLFGRARELSQIGLKNRASTDMLAVIKANPSHPDVLSWIAELEAILVPEKPASISTAPPSP